MSIWRQIAFSVRTPIYRQGNTGTVLLGDRFYNFGPHDETGRYRLLTEVMKP